jgi:hypothetical protein
VKVELEVKMYQKSSDSGNGILLKWQIMYLATRLNEIKNEDIGI